MTTSLPPPRLIETPYETFHFFFGATHPCSNWYARDFVVRGITFAHNEQLMMYCKGRHFKDEAVSAKILETTDPMTCKKLGRAVKGFVEAEWLMHNRKYVLWGALEKFRQHADLTEFLLATQEATIVEASPYDRLYGIGVAMWDPRRLDRVNWTGLNLLGDILMDVRYILQKRLTT